MHNAPDYYEILGVERHASDAQLREAYIYKVNILHPDRMKAMPERIRLQAEEELKAVNAAFAILSNPTSRRQYDVSKFGIQNASPHPEQKGATTAGEPRPEIYPRVISFKDALPYVMQKEPFFIRNTGGPFKRVLIGKTPDWIKIAKTIPLQVGKKLPMQINVEAIGVQWGTLYSSEITVRLDESEARVKIELRTRKKPR